MTIELTFDQIEDRVRENVASGDDRVSFNRLYMQVTLAEIDRLRETVALERELSHRRFLRIEELGGRQP